MLGAFLPGVMLSVLPSHPEGESYRSVFHRMVGPVHEHVSEFPAISLLTVTASSDRFFEYRYLRLSSLPQSVIRASFSLPLAVIMLYSSADP